MFQLDPDPTFDADVGITQPGGSVVTVRVTFRYYDEAQYAALVEAHRAAPMESIIYALVADWATEDAPDGRWHGMPLPYGLSALEQLRMKQPRALQSMLTTWLHEVKGLPLKN